MAPAATIVVYHVSKYMDVVADSLTYPVNGISRNNVMKSYWFSHMIPHTQIAYFPPFFSYVHAYMYGFLPVHGGDQ